MPASRIIVSPSDPLLFGDAPLHITIRADNKTYTHTVRYQFGALSGTLYTNLRASKAVSNYFVATKEFSPPTSWTEQIPAGAVSLQGVLTCETYDGGTKIGENTATFELALSPSTCTVSGDCRIGTGSTQINISRIDTRLTHQFTYDCYSGQVDAQSTPIYSGTYPAAPTGDLVIEWVPPLDILTDLVGTSSLTRITLKTYNGSVLVGETTYQWVTLAYVPLPATRPQITALTFVAANPAGYPAGLRDQYIAGISKLRIIAEYSTPYSQVDKAWVTLNGVEVISNLPAFTEMETAVLQTSGTLPLSVTVRNTRGETDTLGPSSGIPVYPYTRPRLLPASGQTGVVCVRALADGTPDPGGTALLIQCGRAISTVGGFNSGYITYSINGGTEVACSSASTAETEYISVTVPDALADQESTYSVLLKVYDDVSTEASVYPYKIPKTEITLHLREGGLGVGIGQYSQNARRLEISPSWDVTGRVFGLGNLPVISSGEDLNSYHTPGRYAVVSNTVAASLSNCPASEAGVLTVYASTGSMAADPEAATWQYILQEYRTYTGTAVYQRYVTVGGTAGSWTYNAWFRTYPQANAGTVALTYTNNALITSANFTAGFTLHKTGPLCILSINAQPTSSTAASLTAIGNVPAGSRPKIEIVQTSIQQDTTFAPVAVDIGAASGNIFLYKPNASTARIRLIIPYFTDL